MATKSYPNPAQRITDVVRIGGDDTDVFAPEEVEDVAERDRQVKIEGFALSLLAKRDSAVKARAASGVESRWVEDSDAYHGRDAANRVDENWEILTGGVANQGPEKKPSRRSRVFVQVSRQKTNTAAARLQDLLFPSDERNWDMKPTPVPKLNKLLEGFGATRVADPKPGPTQGKELPHPTEDRPLTAADIIGEQLTEARKRCDAMRKEIDDQHTECQFNDQGRKAIEDAAKLGTGILKGPVVVNRVKKAWIKGEGGWEMQIQQDLRPATFRVDPWNFFPASGCGDDFQKGGYCWERDPVSPSTLKLLAQVSGYDRDAILKCLAEGPRTSQDIYEKTSAYLDAGSFDRSNFDLWNYTGEVNADDLEALGMEVTDEQRLSKISAMVTMCNTRVIKAILNPMDSGDLPYDMFQWDTADDSPWGFGIPYLMRYAQRSLNVAWRQMQDNAGVSHGPQIVVNRRLIEPANKSWTITGMKVWHTRVDASVEDVSKAFGVYQINSNQDQLERIINLCLKFIDDETAVPMLAQGEKGTAPDKVGIVSMLMNASNVVLKRLARNWDARITNTQIRRYFDWNMQYSEREDIKGDFEIHALGSTNLVVRDQQKQDIQNLMAMSQQPMYEKFVNPKKVMEVVWKMSSVPDVLYSENELKEMEAQAAKQPPPEEPMVQVAKIRAEAAVAAEKTEAESERVNQQLRMEEARRNDEREIYKMELQRDLEVLKAANAMNMQVNEIKAQLAGKTIDLQAKVALADRQTHNDHVKDVRQLQSDHLMTDKQIQSDHALEERQARNARVLEGTKALHGKFNSPKPKKKAA